MRVDSHAPRGKCLTEDVSRMTLVADNDYDRRLLLRLHEHFLGVCSITFEDYPKETNDLQALAGSAG